MMLPMNQLFESIFPLGGTWCLDFKYFVTGSSSSLLSIYKVVNGIKGNPIFTENGSSTQRWRRQMLEIDGSSYLQADMIEVKKV